MKILGIDPGLQGGYALIDDSGKALAELFPLAGKGLDLAAISEEWRTLAPDLAVMERVHSMPQQSAQSGFTFGRGFGALEGILATLGVHLELVTPQAWKKDILAGTLKDMDAAIAWARRAYPAVSLIPAGCRTPKDGMADALAIAEWGRLKFGRG